MLQICQLHIHASKSPSVPHPKGDLLDLNLVTVPGLLQCSHWQYVYLCTLAYMDNNLVYCTSSFVYTLAEISVVQHTACCCCSFVFLHKDNPLIYFNTVFFSPYSDMLKHCTAYNASTILSGLISYWYYFCPIYTICPNNCRHLTITPTCGLSPNSCDKI